jgi:hypothetical protein
VAELVSGLVLASGLVLVPGLELELVLVWHNHRKSRQLPAKSPMVPEKFSSSG